MMKLIDDKILDALSDQAASSPRKRAHYNLHPRPEDSVQRLCIAAEPGSYFRPGRHAEPETWEVLLALRGSFALLLFDDTGLVLERTVLAFAGPVRGVEIPPKQWHTLASLEPGSVFFEIKQGPYVPMKEKDLATWAPAEGSTEAAKFEAWYRIARVGERQPSYRA